MLYFYEEVHIFLKMGISLQILVITLVDTFKIACYFFSVSGYIIGVAN